MEYLEFLLARCTAIGIDPAHALEHVLHDETTLETTTSDAYFERPDALAPFEGRPIDFAFIDGMHLVDFVLRDLVKRGAPRAVEHRGGVRRRVHRRSPLAAPAPGARPSSPAAAEEAVGAGSGP